MHLDPPGPPSAPVIEDVTKDSCKLSWKPPEQDGGTPVTGYFVERSAAQSSRWIKVTRDPLPEPIFSCNDLVEGNEYDFRAIAINKAGEGPAGEKCRVLAKDPWGL